MLLIVSYEKFILTLENIQRVKIIKSNACYKINIFFLRDHAKHNLFTDIIEKKWYVASVRR